MELNFLQTLPPEKAVIFLFILTCWGFWYLREKIKSVKDDLEEFQQFQEKKCEIHKNEGQKSFDRLEAKIEQNFKTVFDRIENFNNLLIRLISEKKD